VTIVPVQERPPLATETGLAAEADAISSQAGTLRSLLVHALVAIFYVVTGRLGLLLAVPPGYATAIFPPAGIAAAAMLTAGPAALPWIFLGSLILNGWIGYIANATPLTTVLGAASLIAAASTAQAALTGWALKRAIGCPPALDNGGQLWRFLVLTPLCCLTSATLSLTGLWTIGVVSREDLATSWVAWWVGDTLGVLVVLPLMLVFLGEPRALWRARLRPVALPMLLFFGLFVAIFIRGSAWENDQQMLEFRLVSQQVLDKVHTRLEEQEAFLEQLERSFHRVLPVTRTDFTVLAQSALRRFPMVQAIEWAPRVGGGERLAFEAAQRQEVPQFEIREPRPPGQPHRAGERDEYYPVTYVEPPLGNEAVLGLDVAADPDRRGAVDRALASGRVSATRPLRLVQGPGDEAGLLLLLAVRDGANGPGLVLAVLRARAFIAPLLAGIESTLHLRLIDAARQRPVYDDFSDAAHSARYRQEFDFGLRHYVVETEPTALYLAQKRGWQSWVLLAAGVLGTGLLGALLLLGSGYAHRIQAQVDERTRDLAAANRQLRIEIEERQHAETALRQAQRMEVIGRLTGGIAHDFNNLLTVVSANAELLGAGLPGDEPGWAGSEQVERRAAAILRAAMRGQRLIRQLLTFSRQQTLRPETVDLRQRTGEIAEMLARTMREDIEMQLDLPEGLWPVAIDPAEFDLAILNVAANARDAMPKGGDFRVTARNLAIGSGGSAAVSPNPAPGDPALGLPGGLPGGLTGDEVAGDFVALTLSDSGSGMTSEVAARAFDPYFTTKAVGAGSGLGLSQVYGFARQSGGSAIITSQPGTGTSVTLLLPRARATGAPSGRMTDRGPAAAR
jgi:signal transduction histidine kinase/integral membrane sensor domain MASE1